MARNRPNNGNTRRSASASATAASAASATCRWRPADELVAAGALADIAVPSCVVDPPPSAASGFTDHRYRLIEAHRAVCAVPRAGPGPHVGLRHVDPTISGVPDVAAVYIAGGRVGNPPPARRGAHQLAFRDVDNPYLVISGQGTKWVIPCAGVPAQIEGGRRDPAQVPKLNEIPGHSIAACQLQPGPGLVDHRYRIMAIDCTLNGKIRAGPPSHV